MFKNSVTTPPSANYERPEAKVMSFAASSVLCTSDPEGTVPDLEPNDDMDIFG